MAKAVVSGEALAVRAAALELNGLSLGEIERPRDLNTVELCVAAGLLELLAERAAQLPPAWTKDIPPVEQSVYLVQSAHRMPRLRQLCQCEGPEVLKRRNLFAPPNYLTQR